MKLGRTLLSCLLVIFLVVGTCILIGKTKKGFGIDKIRSRLEYSSRWAIESASQVSEEVDQILSQDFNYLGCGAQCYAFLSADGNYVLKFFKMKHLTPKTYLKYLPVPGLDKYRFNKIEKRLLRQQDLFLSYKMAYEELKEETGLLYVHLNKTHTLHKKLKLYDRMRHCFEINLDDYEFVLQLKSQLVCDRIVALMQRGDKEGVSVAINSLLTQVVSQCKKGYIDRDSGISHNYGFVGNHVIHFDVGRLMRDETAKDPTHYQREVLRVGKKLEQWLTEFYPNLLPLLEEQINSILDLEELVE